MFLAVLVSILHIEVDSVVLSLRLNQQVRIIVVVEARRDIFMVCVSPVENFLKLSVRIAYYKNRILF